MALAPKHQRFVAEYVKDLNATQAAIRAGYSEKTAKQQGSRLLTNADIAAAVEAKQVKQLASAELSATGTKETIRRQVHRDIRQLFDADGNLIPIHKLSAEAASMISAFEIVKRNITTGDGTVDVLHKIRLDDRRGYVEMAAKHFGLLEEKVAHSGHLTIGFDGSWQPPVRD
jgi:phage terminase small subunit